MVCVCSVCGVTQKRSERDSSPCVERESCSSMPMRVCRNAEVLHRDMICSMRERDGSGKDREDPKLVREL